MCAYGTAENYPVVLLAIERLRWVTRSPPAYGQITHKYSVFFCRREADGQIIDNIVSQLHHVHLKLRRVRMDNDPRDPTGNIEP